MEIIKIAISYILGYVRITVEGYYIERFINICINSKILIWSIKREKGGAKLYLNVGINDFKKLKQIARKTKCKIKISRKRGIPFILNRYRKRKIFGIFLILIIAIILGTSNYIWNIEIKIENNEIENISNLTNVMFKYKSINELENKKYVLEVLSDALQTAVQNDAHPEIVSKIIESIKKFEL
mgnify:CR=1 FL=1